ncbi:MAG: Uma2 family endonuclease, partial [Chloroflexota bacterium]
VVSVPLESGDHLTRDEFHRRYLARPDIKKAELIDGVVYVASPVRLDYHGRPHSFVMTWLGVYVSRHPELVLADNATVRMDRGGEVQPDALLWRPGAAGPRMNDEGYLEGAPQLIVEVAASSASYDLHTKKEAYRRNGVHEYVVWRVLDTAIDWFRLQDGSYVRIQPDDAGIVESDQFPGLRLDVPRMLAGDLAAVLSGVSAGPA